MKILIVSDTHGRDSGLEKAVEKGRRCGMNDEEIRELFELIMED